MNINKIACYNCYGNGKTQVFKAVSVDEKNGVGRLEAEEGVCEVCNGKGYHEYATFSVEEAEAILKYCGLTTDGSVTN